MTDSGPAVSVTTRGKLLYIRHKILHFIHNGRFLNQLWVEVNEVVIHLSETREESGYISIFPPTVVHHSKLYNFWTNYKVPLLQNSPIFLKNQTHNLKLRNISNI